MLAALVGRSPDPPARRHLPSAAPPPHEAAGADPDRLTKVQKGGDNVRLTSFRVPPRRRWPSASRSASPRRGRSRRRSVRSRDSLGDWAGGGQCSGSNGHASRSAAARDIRSRKWRRAQSIDCLRQPKLQDRHPQFCPSLRGVGPGLLAGSHSRYVRPFDRQIAEGRFEGEFVAPGFSARISLISNGRTQSVNIQPSGGDISDVRIELRRRG